MEEEKHSIRSNVSQNVSKQEVEMETLEKSSIFKNITFLKIEINTFSRNGSTWRG